MAALTRPCLATRQRGVAVSRASSAAHRCRTAAAAAPAAVFEEEVIRCTRHDLPAGLQVTVKRNRSQYEVELVAEPARPMLLHWAINDWQQPPEGLWPANTRREGSQACQTPFAADGRLRLVLPEAQCPPSLVFVLKETQPEAWINDGGTDFRVQLKPPGLANLVDKVVEAESTYTHWSLFNRFCMAIDILDAADTAGPGGMALVYTWLRLSSLRQLDWYRRSNYQSKDIAHVQKTLAQRMAAKARGAADSTCRMFARMALEGLPRGGGNGDDIRMGILHIMRGNGIKEGHRPGIDERFLEQWHQKLHTNTTPDDIAIVEAYLAFLHSANPDDFWRVLWDVGRLSREDLAKFDKPITAFPMHLPHLIDPFKHYRWLLKVTHSGADLDTAAAMAQGFLGDGLRAQVYDILGNRDAWWVPGKVVEVRQQLAGLWKAPEASRDLLLLDIALEGWFRLCLERTQLAHLEGDALLDLVALVLRNALVAVDEPELRQAEEQWAWVRTQPAARWGPDWSLAALAALQRTQLSLAAHMDSLHSLVQPHAERFAAACKLDPKYITNFGEEVVRGRPLAVLSPLLRELEPRLRAAAGVSTWQIISSGPPCPQGQLSRIASLADVQGKVYGTPVLLLAEHVGGNEDIPLGVQAVLTRSATDVLSHAAIRARAQRVLLATCHDEAQWEALQVLAASDAAGAVQLSVQPDGDVTAAPVTPGLVTPRPAATATQNSNGGEPAAKLATNGASSAPEAPAPQVAGGSHDTGNGNGAAAARPVRRLPPPLATDQWVLHGYEFRAGLVGAKALNCTALAQDERLVDCGIRVPASLALPFNAFQRVLVSPGNEQAHAALMEAASALEAAADAATAAGTDLTQAFKVLASMRGCIRQLLCPPDLHDALSSAAEQAGMLPDHNLWAPGSQGWDSVWSAVCQVWASKWNDRAWLSRRSAGIPDEDLAMGVLIQQVVPADYAFVLHTAHPVTGEAGVVYGEVVPGMGETLVGNYPGRALSFSSRLGAQGSPEPPQLLSLPSKRSVLRAVPTQPGGVPLLIARSDANGEDLADLAGAGLYDSVPCVPLEESALQLAQEPLVTDPHFRTDLMTQLTLTASAVKAVFGGVEQDVEGVVAGDQVWVVQSRPQLLPS